MRDSVSTKTLLYFSRFQMNKCSGDFYEGHSEPQLLLAFSPAKLTFLFSLASAKWTLCRHVVVQHRLAALVMKW